MNLDDIIRHYESGLLTQDELFGHFIANLVAATCLEIQAYISQQGMIEAFDPWLVTATLRTPWISAGKEIFPSQEAFLIARVWAEAEIAGLFRQVFDVLLKAGAHEAQREEFLHYFHETGDHKEFRFMGALGFGGKCYRSLNGFRIGAYREDLEKRSDREDIIREVSLDLEPLSARWRVLRKVKQGV